MRVPRCVLLVFFYSQKNGVHLGTSQMDTLLFSGYAQQSNYFCKKIQLHLILINK